MSQAEMNEPQDQNEKRKWQNRTAQRRFRSRKKTNDTIVLDPYQTRNSIAINGENIVPATSWNILDSPAVSPTDYQNFGRIDYMEGYTPDGLGMAKASTFGLPQPHSHSLPIHSQFSNNDAKLSSRDGTYHPVSPQSNCPGTVAFTSHARYLPSSNENLMSPISIRSSEGVQARCQSWSPVDQGVIQNTKQTKNNDTEKKHHMHTTYKTQITGMPSKQMSSESDDGRNNSGCCVAHKAEMMISDVQELCRFGVRYGLLEPEDDDVEECLGRLRAKFREMADCSRNMAYSSSGDSDES